jgi:hypothetical protein
MRSAVAIALGLAIVALVVTVQTRAQQPKRTVWQYAQLQDEYFIQPGSPDLRSYATIVTTLTGKPLRPNQQADLSDALNAIGGHGWELVQVTGDQVRDRSWYFKRPSN